MSKRSCKAKNRQGEPCRKAPLKDRDYCSAHSDDLPDSIRFGSPEQAKAAAQLAGRPPRPRPPDVARQLVEEYIQVTLAPHFRALGYDVVVDENGARLVEREDGGAKLYGESKDGYINLSPHDDLGAQITAADKLLDRIYGRPKQVQEVSGPNGAPVQVASTFDLTKLTVDEKRALLALVEKASAAPVT